MNILLVEDNLSIIEGLEFAFKNKGYFINVFFANTYLFLNNYFMYTKHKINYVNITCEH